MAITKTTRMDGQGRIVLPVHIREELNLNPGQEVTVYLEEGTIKIQPAEKRCVFCGNSVNEDQHIPLGDKYVCRNCCLDLSRILIRKEAHHE